MKSGARNSQRLSLYRKMRSDTSEIAKDSAVTYDYADKILDRQEAVFSRLLGLIYTNLLLGFLSVIYLFGLVEEIPIVGLEDIPLHPVTFIVTACQSVIFVVMVFVLIEWDILRNFLTQYCNAGCDGHEKMRRHIRYFDPMRSFALTSNEYFFYYNKDADKATRALVYMAASLMIFAASVYAIIHLVSMITSILRIDFPMYLESIIFCFAITSDFVAFYVLFMYVIQDFEFAKKGATGSTGATRSISARRGVRPSIPRPWPGNRP